MTPTIVPVLPLKVAIAMAPILTSAMKRAGGDLGRILCESEGDGTRFVATDGNCLLVIDTPEPGPAEPFVFYRDDVVAAVKSKGHFKPVAHQMGVSMTPFTDYRKVIKPSPLAVESIGIDVDLLVIMQKVWGALKLGAGRRAWSFTFTGGFTPIKCKPSVSAMANVEDVSNVLFIIVPCRLN